MAYSLARGERENIGVSHRDTSPPRLGATRQKDIGTTHMDNSKDYGFGWLGENNYDWEASRRETDPMSRRDNLDDWNAYGATLRDDEGEARRDHLGRKKKENLGAMRRVDLGTTGNTRREDFGVSARDGLGATAAYSHRDSRYGSSVTTHSERFHREAAGNRRGELGASRPDYMLNTLTEEQSKATLPEYDYTYTRERPQEPRKWTSVAADRNLMNDWHSMFGQIRTKWAPGTDDPMSISKLSEGRYGYSNSSESQEDRRQRIQRHGLIAVALAVVALVAVIILTVILLGIKSEDNSEVLFKYEYQATLEDEYYVAEMENTSSEAFSNVSNRFCGQLDENAGLQANGTVDNYEGCVVTEISSGSLILTFHIVIRNSRSRQPSPQQVIIFVGLVLDGEETINGFKVTTVIVITQQIEITEDENPVPKKVAFNATCSANQRCITTQAECRGDICTCPVDRYYEETPDKCTPIQCGDVPTVEHGEVTTTGSSYGSTLAVNCNSGYDISDNGSVSCATHGSWGTIPVCNPIECVEFIIPDNAKEVANKTGRMFNESIVISCNDGFEIQESSAVVTCQSDKSWSSSPQCSLVTCSTYNIPNNAVVTSSNSNTTLLNDTITMRCEHGYEIDGEEAVICQANNTWSISPSCNPLVCSYSAPEHGSLSNNATTEGEYNETITVSVECSSGYELEGTTTITCQASANFTAGPTCMPITCQDFVIPDHATVDSNVIGRIFNDVINITCNDGYTLDGVDTIGPETVTCQATETWTESPSCSLVECDQYDPPKHGTVNQCDCSASFNETITPPITCDNGFEVVGEVTITCQANKTFTAGPTCKTVTCSKFDTPEHSASDSTTDERIFNETITITCDDGYDMAGDPVVTCQGNKTWTNSPICNRINCSVFAAPDNANEVSDGAKYFNDSIQLECRNGYELDGEEIVTCRANGQWTESPSCIPVNCSNFKPPSNGIIDMEYHVGNSYDQNITVKCNDGYLIAGPATEYCQANGTWSESSICQIISCGSIDTPANSDVTYDGKEFGDTANITCGLGYEINGPSQVECQSNGTWQKVGNCQPILCNDFVAPMNSNNTNTTGLSFEDEVSVSCIIRFILVGDSTITCDSVGSWPDTKCVRVDCIDDFSKPENGIVANVTEATSALVIQCIEGYELVGNSSVVCTAGNWSESPICEKIDCGDYDPVENGNISTSTGSKYGDSIEIECNQNYKLIGETPSTCQSNGSWTDIPRCIQIECKTFQIPDRADVPDNINDTVAGTKIMLSCVDGYNLVGNESVICLSNGTWTSTPSCEPKDCGKPDEIANSNVVVVNETTFNNSFVVVCQVGYTLQNKSTVTCQSNGIWSQFPICELVSCGNASTPDNADVTINDGNNYGSNVSFACVEGFTLIGKSFITCQQNKSWTESPICEIEDCGDLDEFGNGTVVNQTGTTFGSITYVQCNEEFSMIGNENISCLATGEWETLPLCQKIDCGQFSPPDHASVEANFTINCEQGYEIDGVSILECLNTGMWSEVGTCNAVQCDSFPTPDNSSTSEDDNITYVYGDTIEVSCEDGFEISGNAQVMCGASKQWENIPTCSKVICVNFIVPNNAVIGTQDTSGYVFEEVIFVNCSSGFALSGSMFAKCGANKEWEDIPICEAIPCDEFTVPTNATIGEQNTTGHVFGDTKQVGCLNGFDIVGDSEVGCGTSGEWENIPSCKPKSCPDFSIPLDATIGSQAVAGYVYEQSVGVSCNIGFNISGDSVVTCRANGTWDSYPSCIPIRCVDISVSDNVVIVSNYSNFTFGNIVKLSCKIGYIISGSSEVNCTADGSWTEFPSCEAVPCPMFPVPDNASIGDQDVDGYTYGDVINITCTGGYASSVGLQSICGSDGEWEDIPTCDPWACPVFPTPDNATINDQHPENNTVGDKINVSCNDGFVIDGNPEVVCREEGNTIHWIDIPVCSPAPCAKFTIPANATIGIQNTTGHVYGDEISVSCVNGFNISGNPQARCGPDGNWTSDAICEPVNCKNFPVLNNGSYVTQATEFEFGDTVDVVCDDGYNNTGDAEIKCGNDSQWNGDPLCERVTCPLYIFPDNVLIVNQSTDVFMSGHTLVIECIEGFSTSDGTAIECSMNGTWGVSPTCSPVMCVDFIIPNNSTIGADQIANHTYKDVLNVTCNDGYVMLGNAAVECSSDGYWSESPVCDPVECPKLVAPTNGSIGMVTNDKYFYGKKIFITCNNGFEIEMNGIDWVTCQANSTWSPSPVCSPVQCGNFNTSVANGNVKSVTGTEYTDVVTIECSTGFILIGSSEIMCQANGTWEPFPICDEIQCGNVYINNGSIHASNSSVLTVVCDAGFVLNGTDNILCEDGNWTAVPTCEPIPCPKYVAPSNGNVSYSGNIVGSRVSITCTNGYEVNGNDTALCMEDGNWSENISCDPIDCEPYDVPSPYTHYVDGNIATTYNSSVPVACISGLEHTNASATMVTCEADGMWSGEPDCAILGSVVFTDTNYNFVEGNVKMITCEVTNYPTWQSVVLAKVDMPNNTQNDASNMISMLLFRISNINGSLENTTFNDNYAIDTTIREDGVSLDIRFDPFKCDDEGEYICSVLVGDMDSPVDAKYSNTTATISTYSLIPEIILPEKIYLGKEAGVECIGDIGKGEDGEPTGQLILEAKFGDNGSFVSFNAPESPVEKMCHFTNTISLPIPTDNPAEGVVVRCVILQLNGSRLVSDERTFDILSSYVTFENSSYIFNIGENASLTCDVENIPDWTSIEIRRPSGDVSLRVNSSDTSEHDSDAHITLNAASFVTNDSAKLVVDFKPVHCTDADGEVGTVEYTCRVLTANSTTESTTSITFQKPPMEPKLTMSRQIVEAQPTWSGRTFHCEGEVGNPEGHIEVESNFNGEFSRLLANVPGENKTSYGFILSSSYNVTPSDDCGYHHAFEFALENITMEYMHLKNLRCVTKPAAELDNGMTLYSEEKVMKVIPVTYCEGSMDTFKPHLYYCNYAIECNTDRTVEGVPLPCDIDKCFDTSGGNDNGCKSCDSIGGCSIQVIQCDQTSIASYKGDIVEFTCNTQDVGEVTHISISSPNATPIDTQGDSIQVADGVNVTISQQNVMLRFTNVSCDQEGDYIIRVNNQTEVTLTLSVISDPGQPDIFIPTIMAVNKEMQVNCSGLVGRGDDGKNKATIILEVKFEGTDEYLIYNNGDGMRTEAEADCDISEAVVYDITPDLSWNNSDIRCVTQNDSQDVVYSDRGSIILQLPDIYCEPVLISTDTGALAIFTCGLKDISNIESIVVSRNDTELINEGTTSLPYEYNRNFTLTIPSLDEFVVNFTSVKCADEGEYVITINDISSASLILRVVSDPDEPSLNMPSRGTVNELYEMSCSGPVGRDMYGDAATALYLEVKFEDESEFSIYTNVTRESVSYNNCQYTEIIRLELYPDASWNASTVRCVTRNDTDMVTATGDRQVMLHSANTYFEKADTLAFVGESYLFACIVEHKPGLSDIVISKGINKTVIAAFASNTAIDGVEILADESSMVNETGVLKINMTVQCGDGVEYYCSPVGTGAASEDVISLVVQWKALTPVLDPSSDMVEGNSAWSSLGFETRCSAELGYANASVYFESNINGDFQRIEESLLSGPEFNAHTCSNTVTIKFDKSYTAAWNGIIIRCVVETADELLMDAEYATVIPETYCDGYSTSTQLPHPFDCRAWLTCNERITSLRPNKNCDVDECYDLSDNSKCVPCAKYSKCRPDPMDALPPGTPYMTCSESTGWMGNEASIDCYLSNSTIVDLPNAMVTVLNASGQIFDSTTETPTSSTASEATFSIQGGLLVIIRPTHIEIRFSPVQCYQEGNYTVQYNGSSGLKDTGMLTVQSAQAVPVISKEPAHFYSGLEMKVTCKGNTGKPEGELVLKYRTSSAEPFANVTVEPGSNEFDEQECTYIKNLTYSFFVNSNMDGFGYVCETMSHNGSTSTSETETVTIESPAVYFVSYNEKARLGESITIQCVLANNEGQAGALLSRPSNESHLATELCTANSTGDVTCLDGYSGMVNVEGTNRTLSVTIASVSCSDEGTYYCKPLGNGGLRSRMDLKVTRPLSTPVLNLPTDNAAIAGVLINIVDPVICIVDAGYPADGKQLKVQFRKNGTAAFEDFVIKNAQESCSVNETTISQSGNTFGTDMDEAEFRCGLFANGSDSPIETSNNETLHVMENNCPANSETYTYQYYPYNCHKYIWCYSNAGIAINTCAGGGCPNITETEPNCIASDSSHCSNCTMS